MFAPVEKMTKTVQENPSSAAAPVVGLLDSPGGSNSRATQSRRAPQEFPRGPLRGSGCRDGKSIGFRFALILGGFRGLQGATPRGLFKVLPHEPPARTVASPAGKRVVTHLPPLGGSLKGDTVKAASRR